MISLPNANSAVEAGQAQPPDPLDQLVEALGRRAASSAGDPDLDPKVLIQLFLSARRLQHGLGASAEIPRSAAGDKALNDNLYLQDGAS